MVTQELLLKNIGMVTQEFLLQNIGIRIELFKHPFKERNRENTIIEGQYWE
jgi:hypothetical protein